MQFTMRGHFFFCWVYILFSSYICEDGRTKPIPLQETENICNGSLDPQKVLQLHHREHPDGLHHCLVWQLHRLVRTAQYITWAKLPAIQDLYAKQCQRTALNIVKDSSHPSHRLFALLQHGKRYRSAKSRSKRLLNSFYPQAIRLLNI